MRSLHGAGVVVEAERFELDLRALARRSGRSLADLSSPLAHEPTNAQPEGPDLPLQGRSGPDLPLQGRSGPDLPLQGRSGPDLPLQGRSGPGAGHRAAPPPSAAVSVPGISDVVVETGGVSLRDILGVIDNGVAIVRLPLVPQTVKIGPLAIDVEAGAHLVLEVVIADGGVIDRAQTRGRLEPAWKLPLGVVVQGVYVDVAGNIVADVERFPDVNLTLLALRGLRIPESLPALLDMIFDEPEAPAPGPLGPGQPAAQTVESKGENKSDDKGLLDLAGIEVEANDVVARSGPLRLGAGLTVSSGPKTRLDVSWRQGRLRVHGLVEVVGAEVRQRAFVLDGVSGACRIDFSVDVDSGAFSLAIEDATARVGHVHVEVGGSVIDVDDCGTSAPARLRIERDATSLPLAGPGPGLRYSAELPGLDGRLRGGTVVVDVGALPGDPHHRAPRRVPVRLQPGHARGSVTVSDRHHKVDLTLKDVGLVVDDVHVDAPLVSLHVQQAAARANGRLIAATDLGVAFSGAIVVDAVLDDATVHAGPVHARGRGQAHVVVDDIATGPNGLDVLLLKGTLELALSSGRAPLFSSSLEVLPGATATVVLDKVTISAEHPPRVEGSIVVEATAARCVVDEALLVVPESACRLAVPRFVVDDGILVAEQLHASIKTR